MCAQSPLHVDESWSTLRFAVQAKALRTCARVNSVVDPKDAEIAQLQRLLDLKVEAERRWKTKFHRLSSQLHHSPSLQRQGEEEEEGRTHTTLRSPARSSPPASPSLTSIMEEVDDDGEVDEEELQRQQLHLEQEVKRDQRELRIRSHLLALHRRLSRPQMETTSALGPEGDEKPSTTPFVAADMDMESLVEELRSPLFSTLERQ